MPEQDLPKETSRLKNKSAVISAAASGIGRAIAQLFAKEGARILVVDSTSMMKEVMKR